MAVDALDVPPLAIIPPTHKVSKVGGGSIDLHPGWSTLALPPPLSRSIPRNLSLRKTLAKVPPRSGTPKRPTTGQIHPKRGFDVHVYKGVEILDCLPYNKDRGKFQRALITESGDVSSAEYSKSSTASTPMILKTQAHQWWA